MTRTNPSKTKPRMDKTTDRKEADRKQIIFTEGAKGGGGKQRDRPLNDAERDRMDAMLSRFP